MNPVNATALYVSASRAVLQCDPRQPHSFAEMYKLLPFFRQSLSCLVCGKLLQDPVAPTNSSCQHYVCSGCKGQRMQLKPSCSWCKDYACFQENKQLSVLVQCYLQLCLYVTHSPLLKPISSHVGGSPEVIALLEEVLGSIPVMETEEPSLLLLEEEVVVVDSPASQPLTPAPAPVPAESSLANAHAPSPIPPCSNGPPECNGTILEDLAPSSPELEVCEVVEEQQPLEVLSASVAGCPGLELALAVGQQAQVQTAVCSLREGGSGTRELEEGEVLLLSVEEVLQTLDPLQPGRDSPHTQPDRTHGHAHTTHLDRARAHTYIQLDRAHNYTQVPLDRTHVAPRHGAYTHISSSSEPPPPPAPKPPPVRLHRKRSRSESDRERVKPLPLASILQGPVSHSRAPAPSSHHHAQYAQRPAPSPTLPVHTYSSVSNGGHPKPCRPPAALNPGGKGVKKHPEQQGVKRPHAKPRGGGGGPKAKDRGGRDHHRLLSGCLLPPSPAKPVYKKPVEKKGCKCGRATQNPSVLTCRGQRCPCYSNRKACLDCICRGCQNSYMANGEKKLEAFAVPEKALEQTRLTLGINLTSITAAAALRNPATTSVRGNALLNVATATGTPVTAAFLSPSPPRDAGYEDGLELGFHC